jgi:predicted nucleic acid-binding protein
LATSDYVFDETVTLVKRRFGFETARRLGDAILNEPAVDLIRVDASLQEDAWRLFLERSDQPYTFTDCTSFALMRRLGIREAIALDGDFVREGFIVRP